MESSEVPVWVVFGAKVVGEERIQRFQDTLDNVNASVNQLAGSFTGLQGNVLSAIQGAFGLAVLAAPVMMFRKLISFGQQLDTQMKMSMVSMDEVVTLSSQLGISFDKAFQIIASKRPFQLLISQTDTMEKSMGKLASAWDTFKYDLLGFTGIGRNILQPIITGFTQMTTTILAFVKSPEYKKLVEEFNKTLFQMSQIVVVLMQNFTKLVTKALAFAGAHPVLVKTILLMTGFQASVTVATSSIFKLIFALVNVISPIALIGSLILGWNSIFGKVNTFVTPILNALSGKFFNLGAQVSNLLGPKVLQNYYNGMGIVMNLFHIALLKLGVLAATPGLAIGKGLKWMLSDMLNIKNMVSGTGAGFKVIGSVLGAIVKGTSTFISQIILGAGKIGSLVGLLMKANIYVLLFVAAFSVLWETDFLGGLIEGFNTVWKQVVPIFTFIDDIFKSIQKDIDNFMKPFNDMLGVSGDLRDLWVILGKALAYVLVPAIMIVYGAFKLIEAIVMIIFKAVLAIVEGIKYIMKAPGFALKAMGLSKTEVNEAKAITTPNQIGAGTRTNVDNRVININAANLTPEKTKEIVQQQVGNDRFAYEGAG